MNLQKRLDERDSAPRRLGLSSHDPENENGGGGGSLDTPAQKWGDDSETPAAGRKRPRTTHGGGKGVTLTLRDQEKHIDNLKKENLNIKLRVHFLEERLPQLAPDQVDAALKQNVPQSRELERELERLHRAGPSTSDVASRSKNSLSNLPSMTSQRQILLEQRQSDLKAVRDALKTNDEESKKPGDSHTTAKFSLQLDVDCLKRDIQTLEDALSRACQDIAAREGNTRERDLTIDNLHSEVKDLTTRLGNQTLDTRWKQIDKFETSVQAYDDAKATWRRKYVTKEGELEALKATNVDLAQQLTIARRPAQGDSQEIRTLLSRADNSEKRLVAANNQLLQHEEKIPSLNQKTSTADAKWEARVKEYEARLKAAEEKYKRERQGGKERILELENQIRSLERQHEIAQKRHAQLETVAETAKTTSTSNARPRDRGVVTAYLKALFPRS
ncbi:hypothetical protein BS17DRAFT_805639 [Gyrodon lividus]|nr:hypothetical protein BS17DRAFT_805639 [Gyrodon lividus]